MTWEEFEAGAPELAELARAEFERHRLVLVGTLRKDGSPRISCVLPYVLDGELYLGMMWHSRKAIDLQRDSRVVLHNPISTNQGDELEISLRGASGRDRRREDPAPVRREPVRMGGTRLPSLLGRHRERRSDSVRPRRAAREGVAGGNRVHAAVLNYVTRSRRGFGRSSRPTFPDGLPSVITTSAVKSFSPRISDEPTP